MGFQCPPGISVLKMYLLTRVYKEASTWIYSLENLTLVSITITPSGAQSTHAYDISSHLPSGHAPRINADQYSTAFDPCDTTYYITELNSFKPLTTNFIEVAVNRQTLASQVTQGYWLGLEVVGTE